ncbi:double-stranded RNA-binding protein 1-like [Rhodamnia argentea]|uniref:Double-stranded RNA-binding protein 1-like n=1 Tax=Rhodamnia argentea TaxID=178133 RepID=A0A8B8NFE1_9MYRT|nr:double-stranded RNA-binding protein 1-like [Rhodamnia argentea]
MYKCKLQEECQARKWGLPRYSTVRDGPEHRPRFRSSVSVNGQSFDSPTASDTSRRAQDEAAKLAFLSLSPSPSPPEGKPSANDSSTAAKQQIVRLSDGNHNDQDDNRDDFPETKSKGLGFLGSDLKNQCKSHLQNYTQRRNLCLPVYSCTCDGPPHARRFQATAVVDGCTFESPRSFNTLKEAEHAAAEVALMLLSADRFQEDVLDCHKNLLQELAQREGLPMPVYSTTRTGRPHSPMFVSSVVVGGESFLGKEGNSKKQAEMKAARVAYSVLTERIGEFSAEVGDSEPETKTIPTGIDSSSRGVCIEKMAEGGNNSFSSKAQVSSAMDISTSPKPAEFGRSAIPFAGSSRGTRSYLLCDRVRVYSGFPDIAFPEGITVVPIADDKWVAASLEFPND